MSDKHHRLSGLYAITGHSQLDSASLIRQTKTALEAGLRLLQYRDKSGDNDKRLREAMALRQLCQQYGATLIINDDIELAGAVGAHGVHLGQHDATLEQARQQLGANALIGISCYDSLERAQQAQRQGADYIAFGSFYPSPTKPDAKRAHPKLLQQWRNQPLPVCAIGGITPDNAPALIDSGADMLAVISALWHSNDIAATVSAFLARISHRVA